MAMSQGGKAYRRLVEVPLAPTLVNRTFGTCSRSDSEHVQRPEGVPQLRAAHDACFEYGRLHLLLNEVPGLRAVGVNMLGGEGAPSGFQGPDPGLHAGNVDGCSRIGEVGVVGVQRVGDGPVLL